MTGDRLAVGHSANKFPDCKKYVGQAAGTWKASQERLRQGWGSRFGDSVMVASAASCSQPRKSKREHVDRGGGP